MMKILNDTYLLFVRNIKKTLRTPLWLFLGMMQPVLYLLLYMPLLKNLGGTSGLPISQIAQIFVPGMLIIMGVSNLFAGFGFIPEIREGYITRILVTPASRIAILLALILNQLVTLFLQSVIIIGIGLLLGLKVTPLGLILTMLTVLLVGSAMACVSYIISIQTRSEDGLASLVNTLYLPIMLLSGIMLPISLAPSWLKTAAHFNPFYYAVEGTRALFLGDFTAPIVYEGFLIMLIFVILAIWFAIKSLREMTA